MLHVVLDSFALGIAGFDPAGLFILLGAMAIGAKRSAVIALMATTVIFTFLFGFIPVMTVGSSITHLLDTLHGISSHTWGALTILLGLGLLIAGFWRWHRRGKSADKSPEKSPKSVTPTGLAMAGVAVALSTFLDPAFYGVIVYAANQHTKSASAVSILIWVLLSHSGLILVGVAALTGFYAPVERFLERLRKRWGAYLGVVLTFALIIVGLVAILEGIAKWHGKWLFTL